MANFPIISRVTAREERPGMSRRRREEQAGSQEKHHQPTVVTTTYHWVALRREGFGGRKRGTIRKSFKTKVNCNNQRTPLGVCKSKLGISSGH